MKTADLHSHTTLCNHADGRPEEYLAAARKQGLNYFGVSDHGPWPENYDVKYRMSRAQLPEYRELVRNLQEKASGSGVEVLYGMEIDWVPGKGAEIREGIRDEAFDYLIGSVHEIDGFPFDDPDCKEEWPARGVDRLWTRYAELLLELVENLPVQILAHPDLPKKFGFYPADRKPFLQKMQMVFEAAGRKGIALELNTAGLRKEAREIYPAPELVRMAHQAGMPITLGSDAHQPGEVGYAFANAIRLAKSCGYKAACTFRQKERLELAFD